MSPESATLFARLASPFTAEALFDCLLDVAYFVKNERAQYVVVNRTLADRCGFRDKRDLLGKTAEQVAPAPLGRTALEQDMAVLRTGVPVRNQLELHIYPTGQAGWCLTDKFPLTDERGRVVGLAGVSHDLHAPDESAGQYQAVAAAVNHARANLDRRLLVGELAAVAGLSAYQFDQRIRRLFRLTTGQLLLKFRMDAAAEQLRDTTRPVTQVGLDCGFADQSAFARQFRRTTGLTPGEYRRAFLTTGEAG
ncbi:MAG: AraC family transcriptional regulator [Planctomycetaceae bacterium]|nr:AraC family transcriptional regulator [Planctomycetaceae bacterium]